MRAGALDREIEVQRLTYETDEYGTSRPTATTLATLRAQLVQQGAREFFANGAATTERRVVFRTRFIEGVTPADQVRHEGETFDVTEVREIGRRRGLELHAVSRGGQ